MLNVICIHEFLNVSYYAVKGDFEGRHGGAVVGIVTSQQESPGLILGCVEVACSSRVRVSIPLWWLWSSVEYVVVKSIEMKGRGEKKHGCPLTG